ncbi:hypothetical protein TNCV_4653791 [Trichonephila clavipes]|nr:hypothetical protein TNCV_4653791 [Trichonephila clavipes]
MRQSSVDVWKGGHKQKIGMRGGTVIYAEPVIPCSIRRRVTANVREIKAASKSLGSICGGMERKSRYEVDRLLPESTTD